MKTARENMIKIDMIRDTFNNKLLFPSQEKDIDINDHKIIQVWNNDMYQHYDRKVNRYKRVHF